MTTRFHSIAIVLGAWLLAPAMASAECVHGPLALPGLSGPPQWFGAAGATDFRPQLHDPRWASAPLQPFQCTRSGSTLSCGFTSASEAGLRVLHHGDFLYVSMQAKVDPNGVEAADRIYFGLTEGTSGIGARVIEIGLTSTAAANAPGAGVPVDSPPPLVVQPSMVNVYFAPTATTPSPTYELLDDPPAWLEDIALFRPTMDSWAVNFRIRISGPGSLGIAGALKFFYGMRVNTPMGVVDYSTPASATTADAVFATIVPRSPSAWLDVDALGSACTNGITLDPIGIGVFAGGSMTYTIETTCGGASPIPCPRTNQFRVQVRNVPPEAWGTHGVRARIRIADWGSQVADWKFAPWRDIPGLGDPFVQPTLGPAWAWSAAPMGMVADATIDFTCTAQGSDTYCPRVPNASVQPHQCVLVELGSPPGQNLPFARSAQYRNMNYVGLSDAKLPATISIEGLAALTGQAKDRDVYLYVQTRNLPSHAEKPMWLNHEAMAIARRFAENPPALPTGKPRDEREPRRLAELVRARKLSARQREEALAHLARIDVDRLAKEMLRYDGTRGMPSLAMSSEEALVSTWPSYLVHVYYDTGETRNVGGSERPVLEPMLPFGYLFSHEGPLYGFTHALEGMGANLEEIAPNLYKVKVPSEGSVQVRTLVTAHEAPRTAEAPCEPKVIEKVRIQKVPGGCGCGIVDERARQGSLTIVALALLFFVVTRSRRPRAD